MDLGEERRKRRERVVEISPQSSFSRSEALFIHESGNGRGKKSPLESGVSGTYNHRNQKEIGWGWGCLGLVVFCGGVLNVGSGWGDAVRVVKWSHPNRVAFGWWLCSQRVPTACQGKKRKGLGLWFWLVWVLRGQG